jgi:hypothetical protein
MSLRDKTKKMEFSYPKKDMDQIYSNTVGNTFRLLVLVGSSFTEELFFGEEVSKNFIPKLLKTLFSYFQDEKVIQLEFRSEVKNSS